MQERRILSYIIKEDEIPSSATAWDGSTDTSYTGNVFYIPMHKNNKFVLDGTIDSPTWHSYVEFPFVVDAYLTSSGSYSVSSMDRAMRYLAFDLTSDPRMSNVTIDGFEHRIGSQYRFLGIFRTFIVNNSSILSFNGAPAIGQYVNTTPTAPYIYLSNSILYVKGYAHLLSPGYSIYSSQTTASSYVNGAFADGYVKIIFSQPITISLSAKGIGDSNSDTFETSTRGHWTYPIYVDSE